MKTLFFVFLSCILISYNISAHLREDYYSQSSGKLLPQDIQEIIAKVETLNVLTQPEETKELRKQIGNLKLKLDFFIFAYKAKNFRGDDYFEVLRAELDKGYTQIGFFKDLYDAMVASNSTEIDNDKYQLLLKKSLQWRDQFLEHSQSRDYSLFLEGSSKKDVHLVEKRDIPRLVWGQVSYRPQSGDTLGEIFKNLIMFKISQYIKTKSSFTILERFCEIHLKLISFL